MDKIWLKNYPDKVAHDIHPEEYSNLTQLLDKAFSQHGDSPFSVCMDRWMSYRELDQLSRSLGAWFQAQGLAPARALPSCCPTCRSSP